MSFCSRCGTAHSPEERFCTTCGSPVDAKPSIQGPAPPAPSRRTSSFPLATCLVLFLLIGLAGIGLGGALLWWRAPWQATDSVGETAEVKKPGSGNRPPARWDEGLDAVSVTAAPAQQQTWATAAETQAGRVEQAFRRQDVQAALALISPASRSEFEAALKANPQHMVRFAEVLKTRKLKAAYPEAADFEVQDGKRRFPVTFVRIDGKWYLEQF